MSQERDTLRSRSGAGLSNRDVSSRLMNSIFLRYASWCSDEGFWALSITVGGLNKEERPQGIGTKPTASTGFRKDTNDCWVSDIITDGMQLAEREKNNPIKKKSWRKSSINHFNHQNDNINHSKPVINHFTVKPMIKNGKKKKQDIITLYHLIDCKMVYDWFWIFFFFFFFT